MSRFKNAYAVDGKQTRYAARERAGFMCIRCNSPSIPGKILTTHHFDGDKANDEWWNLMALCQVCHLQIQNKVIPEIPYFFSHSEWIKPYVAGFYAKKYEGRNITREEAESRIDELLAHESKERKEP
jgi:transcription elongation factor Elf1